MHFGYLLKKWRLTNSGAKVWGVAPVESRSQGNLFTIRTWRKDSNAIIIVSAAAYRNRYFSCSLALFETRKALERYSLSAMNFQINTKWNNWCIRLKSRSDRSSGLTSNVRCAAFHKPRPGRLSIAYRRWAIRLYAITLRQRGLSLNYVVQPATRNHTNKYVFIILLLIIIVVIVALSWIEHARNSFACKLIHRENFR